MADDNIIETKNIIDSELMGEVWPTAQPGSDPTLYGQVSLEPTGKFHVRSFQTFRLTFKVGRLGLDDTGAIRVVFRAMGDWGGLQTTKPMAPNYVTASTDTGVPLLVSYSPYGVTPRPRWKSLTVRVSGGYLREGDRITIVFGDTSQGSPGMKMQTCAEKAFEFMVIADVCAVGHFIPIPDTPQISIVPNEPVEWKLVLPTLRRPGESFRLGIKGEDEWGNPSHLAEGSFKLEANLKVEGLAEGFDFPLGKRAVVFDHLTVQEEGTLRIALKDKNGTIIAESNPLVIRDRGLTGYWGDMHGQSGESVGIGTLREYLSFARDLAFLDLCGHQANDFQVNNTFWKHINKLTAEFQEDGRFVTFPGYEWSGNTSVGGDRNVYFRKEGCQIHRSSHALLRERDDLDTDANDARILFEKLADKDCVVYAHVGGRYADIDFAHDPRLETAMEIHSAWGTFEWLLTDGFPLGHRCGVVCNSDGHKGRPGASYPGASTFGAYGGLTCFLTEKLTRDSIFECLRRRHHYGTTGCRLHLDVRAVFEADATLFERDPKAFPDTHREPVREAMMGDILRSSADTVTLNIEAIAQAPIERIEVRNGTEVIKILRGYTKQDLGERIRVIWSGAEYRGRGRETHWTGRARFGNARILRTRKINAWNREHAFDQHGSDSITWEAVPTGNFGGFDAWIDPRQQGNLHIVTNLGSMKLPLADIGLEDIVMDAGGLERSIRVFRLPETNPHREIRAEVEMPLNSVGDNPLWVCVTTEDGFQAWSSPIFVFR